MRFRLFFYSDYWVIIILRTLFFPFSSIIIALFDIDDIWMSIFRLVCGNDVFKFLHLRNVCQRWSACFGDAFDEVAMTNRNTSSLAQYVLPEIFCDIS